MNPDFPFGKVVHLDPLVSFNPTNKGCSRGNVTRRQGIQWVK